MKITDNRKCDRSVCFDSLKVGDVFADSSQEFYMKTEAVYEYYSDYDYYCDICERSKRVIANAVCLRTGKLSLFTKSFSVIPLSCECVIDKS